MNSKLTNILLVLFLSGTAVSCRREPVVFVESFPIDIHLCQEAISEPDSFPFAYAVAKVGEHYIFTTKGEYAFSLTDGNLQGLQNIAPRGHGSGEWLAPLLTRQYVSDSRDTLLYIWERAGSTLYRTRMSMPTGRECVMSLKGNSIPGASWLFQTGEGRFCGAFDDNDCSFFLYDEVSGTYEKKQHPGVLFPVSPGMEQIVLQSTAAIDNEGGNGIAIAYFSYPVLVLRGLDGEMRRVVSLGKNTLPQEDEIPECLLDVDVSRHYVYALYKDPSFPDESSVLVIDWEGAPIARLRIAKAVSFAVDESRRSILAINQDDGVASLFSRYEMPESIVVP